MGFSSDEHTVDYDEHDHKNIMENREIAKKKKLLNLNLQLLL